MSADEAKGVALVTGASHRIGRHIALDLAAHGWDVAVHTHHSTKEAGEVVALIEEQGRKAVALAADLDNENEVRQLILEAASALGPLTLLVNNASMFDPDRLQDLQNPVQGMWKYHQQIQVNLTAPMQLSSALVEQLPDGAAANIINILDQKVWRLTPHFFSYTLAKSALWTATRTLAQALAPQVRVNAIGPGPTLPNKRQSEQEFTAQCASLPLQRCGTPDEIARTIRFITDMPSMTGQMIALDGGRHLAWQTPDVSREHD